MDIISKFTREGLVANGITFVLLAFTGLYLIQSFRSWYRLRHFKGPLFASLSRFWLARHVAGGTMHLDFQRVNEKYGSLARVGPNDLVTSDPEVMKRMLAVRSPYFRSEWYIGVRFDPVHDSIASIRDEERHSELRSIMAAGYSGKENEDMEGAVDRSIQALMDLIRTKYLSTESESKPMDFARKIQYFTLDVISDVAYREPFGYMATDSDLYDYISIVEGVFASALMVTIFPWLNWILRLPIMKAVMPSHTDPLGLGKILGITKAVVAKRFGPNKIVQKDMLGSFIAHGLNQVDAEAETVLQVMAGSDTTATAMRATLLYLLMNPRVVAKLRHEISTNPISSPIQDAEARKLPYLQAIIKEGLRVFPPVVGLMSKEVPAGGDVINGLFVPGGTKIGYGAYGIFRNKTLWGQDANTFRPERWLEASPDHVREMESTLDLIFSYGKYQCLGKNLAQMELNKMFVELFRNFDLNVVNPINPIRSICHGIFFQSQMWLTAFERPKN